MRNKQKLSALEQAAQNLLRLYPSKAAALLDISELHNRLSETKSPEGLHLLIHLVAKIIMETDN